MQKLRFLITILALGYSSFITAQFTINGTVLDSASREPLYNASVFCQNTTSGTVTNNEGEFSLNIEIGRL